MNFVRTLEALVDALQSDPFYAAISQPGGDKGARRRSLARYFDLSLTEGQRLGRLVMAAEDGAGAAIWHLPGGTAPGAAQAAAKHRLLAAALGDAGADVYHRIVDFMAPRAAAAVGPAAWYLSILGVAPRLQGRGLGAQLLAPTLADADGAGVECYLETFDDRNPRFYGRLGFATVACHAEPVTGTNYRIMVRPPLCG